MSDKLYIDIERILLELELLPKYDEQISLQVSENNESAEGRSVDLNRSEKDFNVFAYDLPYTNSIISKLKMYRTRVMRMNPRSCYSYHKDPSPRIHIPLITNDKCFFVVEDEIIRLPADGNHYTIDTTKMHTFVNASFEDRLHIVGCVDKYKSGTNYDKLNNWPEYEHVRNLSFSRDRLPTEKYKEIHTKNLVPLNLKIDCDLFEKEIKTYDHLFEQFGPTHADLERYSLGLTDLENPIDASPSPVNWPMDVWCVEHPNNPLFDTDFKYPTETMKNMKSMNCMKVFEGMLARCNILKWNTNAHFKPHLDVSIPPANLRLWGTNDPDNNHFCFWDDEKQEYVEEKNVERGRLYLADTSKWHHAYSTAQNVYTFFFALQVNSYEVLKRLIV